VVLLRAAYLQLAITPAVPRART